MGESRTKLPQAKSRGLVRTLILKALTSHKTWKEIKDSLHLKICSSDIHTSISHFMDIQQKEKESLAAYIHCFKWEASRCKFDNDAATIRIFIKGLKNAQILATKVYEKGPQSLADAITEVEKLQAAEQLTATLLPPSLVNIMSSDDSKCFQCQESGHMACYCPHIRCFHCDNYGHVAADCPNKNPPSGIPAWCRENNIRRPDRSTPQSNNHYRHYHCDHRDRHRLSRSRSHFHTPRYMSNSCSDSHRSHSRSFHWPPGCSTSCHRSLSTYHYCQDMPHHRSSSCRLMSKDFYTNMSWMLVKSFLLWSFLNLGNIHYWWKLRTNWVSKVIHAHIALSNANTIGRGWTRTLGNQLQTVFFADGKKPKFNNTHYKWLKYQIW